MTLEALWKQRKMHTGNTVACPVQQSDADRGTDCKETTIQKKLGLVVETLQKSILLRWARRGVKTNPASVSKAYLTTRLSPVGARLQT